jgi:ABC-type multidrug transport system fused ATPase/permease subunit
MVLASFAEIISIGAVLPFLGVLTSPQRVFANPAAQPVIAYLGIKTPEQLLLPLTVSFAAASLLSGAIRILLLWSTVRLSFAVGGDLSTTVFTRTLYQAYSVHISRNSSEVINGISVKTNEVIFYIVMPTLSLISSAFILSGILVALLYITPSVALIAFGGFAVIYAAIIMAIRRGRRADSERIAFESTQVVKALQEGLGGIRDILIDGTQATFCSGFSLADRSLRKAQGNNQFISQYPRFAMESLGMVLIAGIAYMLTLQSSDIAKAIPVLAALALGLQRLLPASQQAYQAWATIQGAHGSLRDALLLLDQPMPELMSPSLSGSPRDQSIVLRHAIRLRDVSFRYREDAPWVLEHINLDIHKGSRVGFIGTTGSGKSTLLDIVMGLLSPTVGSLEIDGRQVDASNLYEWRAHIAHVPQSVYLTDNSVARNIAFGVPPDQIDLSRVKLAAERAQIGDSINRWPDGYDTVVGERGVQISGGQRQRIGIARALYKQADVIIFDEATSALDNETEEAVMQSIDSLSNDLTILIIAHRLSTLRNCSEVVRLEQGRIEIR